MTSSYVYILVGVGAVLLIGLQIFISRKYSKNRLAKQTGHINQNPLNEEQKRLLTFGAILAHYRGENLLNLMPNEILDVYQQGLRQQWEITNREQAIQTIGELLHLKSTFRFAPIFEQKPEELSKIQKAIAKGLDVEVEQVQEVNSVYGWDLCRAASLAKWCYWCNLITEDEMWTILQKVSDIAHEHGKSWKEYTISFLLGRTIQGFDLDDIIIETDRVFNSKNPMLGKVEGIDVYKTYSF
ncbi:MULTISPECIES: DUF1266 domain-containing protein [Capnocytophaga]|uniref:DUF1266 domain-containing protein n=1 Tax=Capnocytophaga canis TaxID=1848903 RepID=A0A0B7INZ9_9FLAO|nr:MULTISPECIES: DUF1266 domain-containing protein [Capnocytophaga]ATA74817.1 DUF1266 domain-containing protein [Capnocytophaga sp. H2931]RIY36251.1 DUF1266 domain-containing protein [Capnocytophaga canis]CEN53626.1 conserved hypothetical protein [Capnocytophaga canis]